MTSEKIQSKKYKYQQTEYSDPIVIHICLCLFTQSQLKNCRPKPWRTFQVCDSQITRGRVSVPRQGSWLPDGISSSAVQIGLAIWTLETHIAGCLLKTLHLTENIRIFMYFPCPWVFRCCWPALQHCGLAVFLLLSLPCSCLPVDFLWELSWELIGWFSCSLWWINFLLGWSPHTDTLYFSGKFQWP